ncbi:lipoprotein [Desulfovibrionales bacterium]
MRLGIVLCVMLCFGCATPVRGPLVPPTSSVAVAGFIYPHEDWELLAGVLPEKHDAVSAETLDALDAMLLQALGQHQGVVPSAAVKRCEEVAIATKERKRQDAVAYWQQVGTCVGAEYLVVPFVTHWQAREGGEYGVIRPASVSLNLFLLHVASGELRRFHFEEAQVGLAENLLRGKRFFQRKGRWLTPEELAAEGIADGVKELGL